VTHYDHLGYALACTGDWALVCCGHSHRAETRQVGDVKGGSTWLVNPGTVAGISGPATWVLADLAQMRFEVHTILL
jgi:predicted phosphodiesterase